MLSHLALLWPVSTRKHRTCTLWNSQCDGVQWKLNSGSKSSLAQQAISKTREISGRINWHLVLTLNSQSTRVLAHIQPKEKMPVPTETQKGGSRNRGHEVGETGGRDKSMAGYSHTVGWERKLKHSLQKIVGPFPKKLKLKPSCDPPILLLGICPKSDIKILERCLHCHAHSRIMHSSEDMGSSVCSSKGKWVNTQWNIIQPLKKYYHFWQYKWDLEDIMLSEINHRKKNVLHDLLTHSKATWFVLQRNLNI